MLSEGKSKSISRGIRYTARQFYCRSFFLSRGLWGYLKGERRVAWLYRACFSLNKSLYSRSNTFRSNTFQNLYPRSNTFAEVLLPTQKSQISWPTDKNCPIFVGCEYIHVVTCLTLRQEDGKRRGDKLPTWICMDTNTITGKTKCPPLILPHYRTL